MKPKLLFLSILVIFSVGLHYVMKHQIIQTVNENRVLERDLASERAINSDLTSECNNLQAYTRIVNKAQNELGMINPANDPEKVIVVQESRVRNRTVSRLFDTITPSAEAITNKIVINR